jgi:hypothetical protein
MTRQITFTVRVAFDPQTLDILHRPSGQLRSTRTVAQVLSDEIQANLESLHGVVAAEVTRQEVE